MCIEMTSGRDQGLSACAHLAFDSPKSAAPSEALFPVGSFLIKRCIWACGVGPSDDLITITHYKIVILSDWGLSIPKFPPPNRPRNNRKKSTTTQQHGKNHTRRLHDEFERNDREAGAYRTIYHKMYTHFKCELLFMTLGVCKKVVSECGNHIGKWFSQFEWTG